MYKRQRDCFSEVVTGEEFDEKNEIFARIAGSKAPSTMLSVGDQWETDIAPAEAVGIRGIQVSSGRSLAYLLPYTV